VVSIKKASSSNSCQRPSVASYWRRKYHTQRAQGTLSLTVGQSAGIGLTRSSRSTRSWGAGSVSLGLCVSVLTMAREGPGAADARSESKNREERAARRSALPAP
jgi:hypothetical protein